MDDHFNYRLNFWFSWSLANAIGMSIGWLFGELLGRYVADRAGLRMGILAAAVLFEGALWLARMGVLRWFKTFYALRSLDFAIWIFGELGGWVMGEALYYSSGPVWVTGGAVWGVLFGAGLWITLWFMRVPKPKGRWWFASVPVWTFLGLVGGSFLIGFSLAVGLSFKDVVSKLFSPYIGWAFAGLVLGSLIGCLTGLAMIRLEGQNLLTSERIKG